MRARPVDRPNFRANSRCVNRRSAWSTPARPSKQRATDSWSQRQHDSWLLAGAPWKGPDDSDGKSRGPAFTSTVGTILEPRNVYRYSDGVRGKADLGSHTFHGLRHDFASLLLAGGTPQRIVIEMIGHSNYSMTTRYQHVPDALQREAADRLDAFLQREVRAVPSSAGGRRRVQQ
jgi:integrase